jgi:hypothetical protein
MMDTKENFPSDEGAKPINRLKNRYKDVLPCKLKFIIKKIDNRISFKMINIESYWNRINILIILMRLLSK